MKVNSMKKQYFGSRFAIGMVGLSLALAGSTGYATGFDLGDAANYAVLFQGGGGNTLNINNPASGYADTGRIGIGGTGKLQLSGPLVLDGPIDFAGAVIDNGPYSGNITVNGAISGGHANVQADLSYLNGLSTTLGAEAGTSVTIGGNMSVNVANGMTDASGNKVFTATTASFNNGQTLTINGDGVHNVVFNFASAASFGGKIVLTGGLTSDQVLFNVHGGNDGTLAGGPTLQINNNGDILTGTFLDPNGAISLVHSVLDGRLFGGDSQNEAIVSGGTIQALTVPDGGSAFVLMGLALGCLGVMKRKLLA